MSKEQQKLKELNIDESKLDLIQFDILPLCGSPTIEISHNPRYDLLRNIVYAFDYKSLTEELSHSLQRVDLGAFAMVLWKIEDLIFFRGYDHQKSIEYHAHKIYAPMIRTKVAMKELVKRARKL